MIEPLRSEEPPSTQKRLAPPEILGVDQLGEQIAVLSAQIQAATYHLLVLIREFDEKSGWNTGFRSCAHWLNWRRHAPGLPGGHRG